MKILMVLTNHNQLGDSGQKTGIWLEEFASPYYVFKDAGHEVVLASPKGGLPPVDAKSEQPDAQTEATRRYSADAEAQAQVSATLILDSLDSKDFDALFYPGGHGPMWDLAECSVSRRLIEEFYRQRKPIGAVCHGPAVFRHATKEDGTPLVADREITGFSNSEEEAVGLTSVVPFLLEDELKRLGGKYSKADDWAAYLVKGGSIVTGQNPASSEGCAEGLLELLKSSRPLPLED
jgi:putative intracellular protease/amidase